MLDNSPWRNEKYIVRKVLKFILNIWRDVRKGNRNVRYIHFWPTILLLLQYCYYFAFKHYFRLTLYGIEKTQSYIRGGGECAIANTFLRFSYLVHVS